MISLLTILASRACHADTLKRALAGDEDARRLLARLGIGPTHLDDMRRGSAERLRAATSTTLADYLLLQASLRTISVDSPEAAAIRDRMDVPWRALTPKEHEATHIVGTLYDRLAKLQAERGDIATQAAFEHQLAEADEHARVLEAKLRAACVVLDVPVTTDLAAVVRALLSAHHDLDERMEQVRNLLSVYDNDDVPDAIRAIINRAESAEASSEHGPLVDLLAMGCWRIHVQQAGSGCVTQADRTGGKRSISADGTTVREALLTLREKVKATLPKPEATKPPEPIVLGPWQKRSTGGWFRLHVRSHYDGAYVFEGEYQIRGGGGVLVHAAQGDKDDADAEMRRRGWVLLDDIPQCSLGSLGPWLLDALGRRYRLYRHGSDGWAAVLVGEDGWSVTTIPLRHRLDRPAAHGPQTGPEGERLAMAAALALGFTGGGE